MTLSDVRIYEFDEELRLKIVRIADSGTFSGTGHWKLENVQSTEIGADSTHVTTSPCAVGDRIRPSS